MADNVAITAGSGTAVATDDVASVHYQKVKIDVGADGVSAALSNSNPIPVSDAGSSLTVDNAGTFATQVDGAALTALQLIDNLVLAEDAVHGSADPGVQVLAVRRDANTSLVDLTGDYAPLQVDATGSLKVAIISGAGTGGTSATDDAAYTVGSGSGTPVMGYAAADSVDAGDVGVVRMTTARGLHVHMVDATGAAASLSTTAAKASTATLTSVAGSATSVTLKALNASRLAVEIYNDSTAILYVAYAATATSSAYTKQLQQGESLREELYTGIITGIWASATGNARVTELTT